jgi:hypothetical protein
MLKSAAEAFDGGVLAAVSVSEAHDGFVYTGRQRRVLFVFAKLVAHCMSILLLVDRYHQSPVGHALLDHASIATLGRASIDTALMTMYLSEPSLTADEWNLRRHILYLHDLTNRKRFLLPMQALGKTSSELPFFENYDQMKSNLREEVQRLSQLLQYSAARATELSSGQKVFIEGSRGAAREAGWDPDQFEFNQVYLSNWVHAHPVSFMRADETDISFSHPSEFQMGFSALVLGMVELCLRDVTDRVRTFTATMEADPVGTHE